MIIEFAAGFLVCFGCGMLFLFWTLKKAYEMGYKDAVAIKYNIILNDMPRLEELE